MFASGKITNSCKNLDYFCELFRYQLFRDRIPASDRDALMEFPFPQERSLNRKARKANAKIAKKILDALKI